MAVATAAAANVYELNSEWTMPRNKAYETHLRKLMTFVHRRKRGYPAGTTFTRDQLLQLQPGHIRDWLSMKAFRKTDWSIEAGDRPIYHRANSLEQAKKCVSFFMPNNLPGWCNGHGNPTKAEEINTLINAVKKCEVRGEGAPSRATRPLTQAEFRKEMELLPNHKDNLAH